MFNNDYIKANNYHTDDNHARSFFDKMSMGTPTYFVWGFFRILFRNRKLAKAGKFDTSSWANASLDVLKLIEACGGKFHIEGLDNISKSNDPVVIISNHMSMLESMIFPGLIASKREVTFVVKQSLTRHRLFGPVMRARNPIAVDRQDPIVDFKKVINDGFENLKNNVSVVIFPQSHRMVEFDPKQFNSLGIKLAIKAEVPVIPVAIKTDYWKNGKLLKDLGSLDRNLPIHIHFGEPFVVEGAGKKEHQMVIDFITDHLNKWNQ